MVRLKIALVVLAAIVSASASAQKFTEVRKQVHYSMDLTGWLDVDEAGVVTDHALDQDPATLPPTVVRLVASASSAWRFAAKPQGGPVATRAPMRLRVEAKRGEDGYIADARIAGARFGEVPEQERVVFAKQPRKTATYPEDAYEARVSGNVYLVVRVGRDGKPMQVVAHHVDLTVVDSEAGMERWRRVLGNLGVETAERWRFIPPSVGPNASKSDWTVRIPVRFQLYDDPTPPPGKWELYIPGPKQTIPWDDGSDVPTVGDDAVAPNEVATGSGLRLLTPLEPTPVVTMRGAALREERKHGVTE